MTLLNRYATTIQTNQSPRSSITNDTDI